MKACGHAVCIRSRKPGGISLGIGSRAPVWTFSAAWRVRPEDVRNTSGISNVLLPRRRGQKGEEIVTWHVMLAKAATTVATGVVGVAAYDGLRNAVKAAPVHEAAVSTAVFSLRGVRKAERGAERARLRVGDVVAEARERIGEEASPPAVDHNHDHDH